MQIAVLIPDPFSLLLCGYVTPCVTFTDKKYQINHTEELVHCVGIVKVFQEGQYIYKKTRGEEIHW